MSLGQSVVEACGPRGSEPRGFIPIENFFGDLTQSRAIATGYEETARKFLGAIYSAVNV
jgi:hypothetical protein